MYEEIAQGRETISLGGGRDVATRAYVASFNLRGQMQEKLVGALSGGERGRVHLAKTLLDGCNLLILDEPSNDLDVDTLRSLEEARCTDPRGPTPTCTDLHERTAHQALHDFAGSALVVSHDRWFLDRVCTHTLAFEQSGQVIPCTQTYGVDLSIYPVRPASMPSCLARYLHAPRGRLNSSRAPSPTTTRGASGGAARSHSKTVRSASGAASRGDSATSRRAARGVPRQR